MRQFVSGTDVIVPFEYGAAINTTDVFTPIYTAPMGADLVKLTLTIELNPQIHPEPDINIVALESMTDLQRAETLREAVYSTGTPFFMLNIWKRVGIKRAPVLKDIPVYNGGRYNQTAELTTYFTNAILPIAKDSVIEVQLINVGSGLLGQGEKMWLELVTIEEEWRPDDEISQLLGVIGAQQQQLASLFAGLESAIQNQSELIQLLSINGVNNGGNNQNQDADESNMRIYYHPSGTLTIDGTTSTVPTTSPEPYSIAPVTINGVTLKAGFEVVWEKPMDDAEYPQFEETTYSLAPGAAGTLKYVPSKKIIVQLNDGTPQVYAQFWDGVQWIQRGHYL